MPLAPERTSPGVGSKRFPGPPVEFSSRPLHASNDSSSLIRIGPDKSPGGRTSAVMVKRAHAQLKLVA